MWGDLARYLPAGPSASEDIDLWGRGYLLVGVPPPEEPERNGEGQNVPDRRVLESIEVTFDSYLAYRLRFPGFRTLCALLNSYFGEWRRLTVLEQIDLRTGLPGSEVYGFVVLADTPQGLFAVTQYEWRDGGFIRTRGLKRIRCDPKKAGLWLARMDGVRDELPCARIWNEQVVDLPIFLLHDVRLGQKTWSCAVFDGSFVAYQDVYRRPEWGGTLMPDAEIRQVFASPIEPGWPARVLRADGFSQFAGVAARYADLLAGFWEGTVGRPRSKPQAVPEWAWGGE